MNSVAKIYPKVREIVADVLVTNVDMVALNSRLITDLGAESIDFLDLVFQLEKEFNIKMPRGQLEKNARGNLKPDEFETNGVVTEQGMQVLRNYFSEVPTAYFTAKLKVSEIPLLFTVETFCKLIVNALEVQTEDAVLA